MRSNRMAAARWRTPNKPSFDPPLIPTLTFFAPSSSYFIRHYSFYFQASGDPGPLPSLNFSLAALASSRAAASCAILIPFAAAKALSCRPPPPGTAPAAAPCWGCFRSGQLNTGSSSEGGASLESLKMDGNAMTDDDAPPAEDARSADSAKGAAPAPSSSRWSSRSVRRRLASSSSSSSAGPVMGVEVEAAASKVASNGSPASSSAALPRFGGS
mmetsp:Transcript_34281/g.77477  ORF Transcript_34281/g.77477 Transcript_34281/m.77477 type:complete len:214 (-) Transcript_34281:50-691(-)